MARTAAPERSNFFLTRCNLEPSTRLHEVAEPAVTKPELAFKIATDDLLAQMEQAIAWIKQGDGGNVALRELWASLSGVQAMVARDPGIRMAAHDLYEAASALVATQRAGTVVGVRPWRLLKEANARLRDWLALARPTDNAQLLSRN